MKFTKLSEYGVITKCFNTHNEAVEFFGSDVVPVLSLEEWRRTPRDYKGYENGVPHVLYCTNKGTTYGKCVIVNEI